MTRTTQILFQLLMMLAIASITLNSCEKQRLPGDWDSMKWEDESGLARVDNVYQVPASGGRYSFIARIIVVFGFRLLKKTVSYSCPTSIIMIGKISLDNGLMFSVCPMATSSLLSNHYHFTALLLTARCICVLQPVTFSIISDLCKIITLIDARLLILLIIIIEYEQYCGS